MTQTTPLEEVLLAAGLDVPAAIAALEDAAAGAEVPALSLLARCLTHSDASVRAAAVRALGGARTVHALRAVVAMLNDRSTEVVNAAAEAALHREEAAPQVLAGFDRNPAARRAAARLTVNSTVLVLLLADPESRPEAIERLRTHRPLAGNESRDALLRALLTTGMLPPADAASLFRDDPPSAGVLALQIFRNELGKNDAHVIRDAPRTFAPPGELAFVPVVEWLDATPGAWRALLDKRTEVLDSAKEPDRMASLVWLSLTVHAARLHAARGSWNAGALAIESTTMPWLLLSEDVPLEIRREALRAAAGTSEHNVLRASYGWDDELIANCLRDPVSCKSSGLRDLRGLYALVDVHSAGRPLRALDTRLGRPALLRAARDGADDLAWMISRSKYRGSDHLIATEWLQTLAAGNAPVFVEVTKTLPLRYWMDVVSPASDRQLGELLDALSAGGAPAATWSAWASAITGAGPSVSAVLESAGYRAVRPSTPRFPHVLSAQQEAEAKRIGIPAILEHVRSGIVLVLVPGDSFFMGARDADPDAYPRERPVREVSVDPHYVAVTPVTQGQWTRALPDLELPLRDGPAFPARGINWKTAGQFLAKLNCGMRLPREAEWEHAARAGSPHRYWWGDDFVLGNVNCQGELATAAPTPAGTFPPNAWGLVDILGNVWEWCEEWFTDPMFPAAGRRWRVLRGGSWFHERWNARVTERFWGEPEGTDATGIWGLRPVLDVAICFGG